MLHESCEEGMANAYELGLTYGTILCVQIKKLLRKFLWSRE
jgi:hypothetical protein